MNTTRICAICGDTNWKPFLSTNTDRIATSDQRIVAGNLDKSICQTCGVVANTKTFSDRELANLYGQDYGLQEHYFFMPSGLPIARSEAFARWILPHLSPNRLNSVLEIGCGQGNLLQRLQLYFPNREIKGIDGSRLACISAQAKGLDVEQGLILGIGDKLPKSDAIIAIAVAEHTEDISGFISILSSSVSDNGRVIFSQQVQDCHRYDVFINEHVWHFTVNQFCRLLSKNGLEVIYTDCNHPIIQGSCLFVCRPLKNILPYLVSTQPESGFAILNKEYCISMFDKVNRCLDGTDGARIAVFGGGEILAMLLAYTSLGDRHPGDRYPGDRQIVACLDEDMSKVGTVKHGIEVQHIGWLKDNPVDKVLLTMNPRYHTQALEKLKPYNVGNIEILSWA